MLVSRRKLLIPPLPEPFLPRPHLAAATAARRIACLIAPAGYGKTTLLAESLAGAAGRRAWYTLDEADGDPTLLVAGLAAALGAPAARSGAPGLNLAQLCRWLEAQPEPAVLILDDLHTLVGAEAALRWLSDLLAQAPPDMRLCLAARSLPPLPALTRRRLLGQVCELGPAVLAQWTPAACDFVLERADSAADPGLIAPLLRRVAGAHLHEGHRQRVQSWLEATPEAVLEQMPDLLLAAGEAMCHAGRVRWALRWLHAAVLGYAAATGDGMLTALCRLALAHGDLGEWSEAEAALRQVEAEMMEAGVGSQAEAALALAVEHSAHGRWPAAAAGFRRAAELFQRQGQPARAGAALADLGARALVGAGQTDGAIAALHQARGSPCTGCARCCRPPAAHWRRRPRSCACPPAASAGSTSPPSASILLPPGARDRASPSPAWSTAAPAAPSTGATCWQMPTAPGRRRPASGRAAIWRSCYASGRSPPAACSGRRKQRPPSRSWWRSSPAARRTCGS